MAGLPQAPRLLQLAPAEQFAAAELFRGTMVMHSVVAYRSDRPGGSPQPDFGGDAWQAYVPIRLPDTVCVQDAARMPPGAAAVLINRNHTDKDLFLPIDAVQKRLLDAVDGQRSIADIVAANPQAAQPASAARLARDFFERLWCWDQVVFDTSRQAVG
jgi:hypothetical protein